MELDVLALSRCDCRLSPRRSESCCVILGRPCAASGGLACWGLWRLQGIVAPHLGRWGGQASSLLLSERKTQQLRWLLLLLGDTMAASSSAADPASRHRRPSHLHHSRS